MKFLKQNSGTILLFLFEMAVGILLLIDPVAFTSVVITMVGVLLMINGLFDMVRYFRTDKYEAARNFLLAKGLVILLAGAFCTFKSQWFITTFSILTVLYGIAILVTGISKLQWTVDMIRIQKRKWVLMGISALVSVACAVIILANPFASTTILWKFTGVVLIVEAVFDFVSVIISHRSNRQEPDEE